MMSSKAVLLMWYDIKNKYPDVQFLMTARLNQMSDQLSDHDLIENVTLFLVSFVHDLVENLFSRLRGLGKYKTFTSIICHSCPFFATLLSNF